MGDLLTIPAGKLLKRRMPEILAADQALADHHKDCPDCTDEQRCAVGQRLYNNDALSAWREVVEASRRQSTTDS